MFGYIENENSTFERGEKKVKISYKNYIHEQYGIKANKKEKRKSTDLDNNSRTSFEWMKNNRVKQQKQRKQRKRHKPSDARDDNQLVDQYFMQQNESLIVDVINDHEEENDEEENEK